MRLKRLFDLSDQRLDEPLQKPARPHGRKGEKERRRKQERKHRARRRGMQKEAVEFRKAHGGAHVDFFRERAPFFRSPAGPPCPQQRLPHPFAQFAGRNALRTHDGDAQTAFEFALFELSPLPNELPLFREHQNGAPSFCKRGKERKTAGERRALRDEAHDALGARFKIGAGGALLHAEAVGGIDAGKVGYPHPVPRQHCFPFERAHRDAVPVPDARVSARERVIKRALARIGIADKEKLRGRLFHRSTFTHDAASFPSAKTLSSVPRR